MKKLEAVDALKAEKADKEVRPPRAPPGGTRTDQAPPAPRPACRPQKEMHRLTETGGASGHQKLRVCETCGAYLSILDSDRRLADHFGGKVRRGLAGVGCARRDGQLTVGRWTDAPGIPRFEETARGIRGAAAGAARCGPAARRRCPRARTRRTARRGVPRRPAAHEWRTTGLPVEWARSGTGAGAGAGLRRPPAPAPAPARRTRPEPEHPAPPGRAGRGQPRRRGARLGARARR